MFKEIIKKIVPEPIVTTAGKYYRSYKNSRIEGLCVGRDVFVNGHCEFEKLVSVGNNVFLSDCKVGRFTYFSNNIWANCCKIGRYCSIAKGSYIGLDPHPTEGMVSTHSFFYDPQKSNKFSEHTYADKKCFETMIPTEIGNDVWVSTNALIKAGLKIGDGVIIGAGAVVTKDVKPYAIVGGVPAKLIRYRFTEPQIKFLLDFKWWDKSEEWLKENWKDLLNIEKFVDKYS